MAERDGFVRRWSQRKADARRGAAAPPADTTDKDDADRAPEDAGRETAVPAVEDLPDVDSLDENSDFRVFMADGVPPDLRAKALRRLWRLKPGVPDGLDDYADDFTDAALVVKEGLKSAYRAGRGYLKDEPPPDRDAVEADRAIEPGDAERTAETGDAAPDEERAAETAGEPETDADDFDPGRPATGGGESDAKS